MKSFDPRINRIQLPEPGNEKILGTLDEWETYEVFHQRKRGEQHVHAGIVHAPNPETALIFAKEQYGRRRATSNIWVVKSSEIHATAYEDQDMWETVPGKTYREASDYYIMDRIRKYQKENDIPDRKEKKRDRKK